MSTKKLYALTDSEASELRRIMDQAQSQALTDQDGVTYEDLTYLMVPLNTPLDRDAAVERMARAAFKARCETESFTWAKAGLFRKAYLDDARAALAALLDGEQS